MVRLVVQCEHVPHAHQVGHDPLEHLALALDRVQIGAAALEEGPAALGDIHRLAALEGVEVCDDDLCAVEIAQHVGRHKLSALVIAVRIVGLEHAEAVLDRDAGSDDQETAGEAAAVGAADGVDRLPSDEHGHDGGLAGPGSELQRQPGQVGICLFIRLFEMFEKRASGVAERRRDLAQPNHCLHRFDLTEERSDFVESMMPPVLEQPRRLRRYPPLAGLRQRPPTAHGIADAVNRLREFVLLAFGRDPLRRFVENQRLLRAFALLGLGDRRDERDLAPPVENAVRRLAALVKLPVLRRNMVR